PVDVTGALLSDSSLFGKTLQAIAKDPGCDAYFVGFPVAGAGYDVEAFAQAASRLASETGKPVVAAAPQPNVAQQFVDVGVPTFSTEAQAIAALNQFLSHRELMEQTAARAAVHPP